MNTEDLFKTMQTLNQSETYYKTCFLRRGSKYLPQNYITNFDFEDIVSQNEDLKQIMPPEADRLPGVITDNMCFKFEDEKSTNIIMLYNNRYTPVFMHQHTFYEVVTVLSGHCTHVVNGKMFSMEKGDVCFVSPGTMHQLEAFNDETIIMNMLISKRFLSYSLYDFYNSNNLIANFFTMNTYTNKDYEYLLFRTGKNDFLKESILELYYEAFQNKQFKKQIIENLTTVFFAKLIRDYAFSVEQTYMTEKANTQSFEILSYIRNNFPDVSLDSMAKHFGYTMQYMSKKIKECSGRSFNEIMKVIRDEKARFYLLYTQHSIYDISAKLGYQNPESFIKSFKKRHKTTPGDYRQKK